MSILKDSEGNEIIKEKALATKQTPPPRIADISEHWVTLENIACTDYEWNQFEYHSSIQIARDYLRQGVSDTFSLQSAIRTAAHQNVFIPSAALTANIIVTLAPEKNTSEIADLLSKLIEIPNIGLCQNTTIIPRMGAIAHYPSQSHVPIDVYAEPQHHDSIEMSYGHLLEESHSLGYPMVISSFFHNLLGMPYDRFSRALSMYGILGKEVEMSVDSFKRRDITSVSFIRLSGLYLPSINGNFKSNPWMNAIGVRRTPK